MSPDPRGSLFSYEGYDWGQVVSWQWVASSVGALSPYLFLNSGVILTSILDIVGETQWLADDIDGVGTSIRLTKKSVVPPIGVPPFTVDYGIEVLIPSISTDANGGEQGLFPTAIREWGPWGMSNVDGPVLEIPNGLKITPARWDLETT